ncbi:MAG: GNAT family N-acetyltransferase [Anaerolineaceae bacterium]|nr:GNAT family N-acetyltransferase [Anaerolineaceae bacterium]
MDILARNIPLRMEISTLAHIPMYSLPEGYETRWYEPGNEQDWTEIHLAADPYSEITPELFEKEFGSDAVVLGQRQCYLYDPSGKAVGTASAWYNEGSNKVGRLHWVALMPELHGKGLSKPLLSVVMRRMADLGYTRANLHTSSGRLPALCLYTSFGFVPAPEDEEEAQGWAELMPLIEARVRR